MMQSVFAMPQPGEVTEESGPRGLQPRKADCVHDELLADGCMILYNACRQQVLTVNPTAALVWECCDGAHNLDALVAEVRDVFPDAPAPDRDIRELLDHLYDNGMLIVVSVQD